MAISLYILPYCLLLSIAAPTAVDMVELEPKCDPCSQNLTVLLSWKVSKLLYKFSINYVMCFFLAKENLKICSESKSKCSTVIFAELTLLHFILKNHE